VGQNTAITPTCKDRIAVYGARTVLFGALLILSGCTREEATASLRGDLQVDEFEIVHARFPCRSPDMHFFGYRFRIGVKREYAFGDICWDAFPASSAGLPDCCFGGNFTTCSVISDRS
jgi:hypothetical protein